MRKKQSRQCSLMMSSAAQKSARLKGVRPAVVLAVAVVMTLSLHALSVEAAPVGVTAAVNKTTYGTAPGAARQVMVLGDNVIYRHRIETSDEGLAQILLNDGSTFTVGPGSDLIIDEFVYDPNSGTGTLIATLSKGAARFVGGKLSKNEGAVSVKTPVGTIGIRGAIANLKVDDANSSTFSLIFGDELIFTDPQGISRRVFEPGYTIQTASGGRGSAVRRTTSNDIGQVQSALAGRAGQRGGTRNPPTPRSVVNSGFPNANSRLPANFTAPPRKPNVVRSTEPKQAEHALAPPQVANQEHVAHTINKRPVKTPEPETPVDPEVPVTPTDPETPIDPVITVDVRILTPAETFVHPDSETAVISDPGSQGLIGLGDGHAQTVAADFGYVEEGNATELAYAQVAGNPLYQFVFKGKGSHYYQQALTSTDYVAQSSDGSVVPDAPMLDELLRGPVTGYARGVQYFDYDNNFLAFAHFFSNGAEPAYKVGDVALGMRAIKTDFSGVVPAEPQVRSYALTPDPTLSFSLGSELADGGYLPLESAALMLNPLVAKQFGSDFVEGIQTTPLYVLEQSSGSFEGAKKLASSFLISGAGAAQRSFVSLLVDDFFANEAGNVSATWERRGSQRVKADQTAGRFGGRGSLQMAADGGYIFGPDADYMVLGLNLDQNDPYSDSYLLTPAFLSVDAAQRFSGSFQVASLAGKVAKADLERETATYLGYATGAVETSMNYGSGLGAVIFSSRAPSDLSLKLDADASTVQVSMIVSDATFYQSAAAAEVQADNYLEMLHFQFGSSIDGTGTQRGIFVDADTYAARDPQQHTDSYAVLDSEEILTQLTDENSHNYFIPSTVAGTGDDALFIGKTECTCAFLEWGYWGGELELDGSQSATLPDGTQVARTHMGTWVAGDVLSESELPATGSASYAGHAVGSVIRGSGNAANQYLAAGDFSMSVDFASRSGSATISNFDGRSLSADLNNFAGGNTNKFYGAISNQAANHIGTMHTSVVRGPTSSVQGVIGDFNARDADWQATGIIAGELQTGANQ
ncbi:FecR domain-containing protein [Roseibium sp. CAU 1637]|uniref:FecR domain-containing protein n=1 Tax=Roseibium limicola TaxID=2816037 RepID=A0A939EQS7_9HYPH|nr:FecR family protein [Roseibium limicola]MBO0345379.1 FecR domain-containing protein [Roseibium limicola]